MDLGLSCGYLKQLFTAWCFITSGMIVSRRHLRCVLDTPFKNLLVSVGHALGVCLRVLNTPGVSTRPGKLCRGNAGG